jgi:hypothetical protein
MQRDGPQFKLLTRKLEKESIIFSEEEKITNTMFRAHILMLRATLLIY